MLTGKMVRVRYARDRVVPYFIDPGDESWRLAAENLLDLYRAQIGQTRGELLLEASQASVRAGD